MLLFFKFLCVILCLVMWVMFFINWVIREYFVFRFILVWEIKFFNVILYFIIIKNKVLFFLSLFFGFNLVGRVVGYLCLSLSIFGIWLIKMFCMFIIFECGGKVLSFIRCFINYKDFFFIFGDNFVGVIFFIIFWKIVLVLDLKL